MKAGTAILLGGVAIGAYILYKKSEAVQNLNFIPRGIGTGPGGLVLSLGIQNVSSATLYFNSFVGNLLIDGAPAGNVTLFHPTEILPGAETMVPLAIGVNLFGSLQYLINQIAAQEIQLPKIALDGNANIGTVLYPVKLQFN